ncbi:carboxymuconolactone decarboxylase family protein [Spongiactinospora sp. TRM90649]|uniref:carboxymuconolactone decarboxylase family protein n=1 Tax=Spongiactinospora sp. TRM90649 TaxID=3031114 RepID=UPI0023F7C99F|nr:carboxymuconolactone decarboxylase family protein [Spongiactinospora sp. TRM90649]MDF5751677.1 carboxymuconolactone decarboxylase family protein [Spongiactinospora sp. TRM90649]
MHPEKPRIEPMPVEEYHRLERDLFGDAALGGTAGVSRTWAHNPGLMKAQRPLQEYLLGGSTLPPRHRELAILRVTWLCGSEYAFGQHTLFGARAGLTPEEIARVPEGPSADGWTPFEAALLRAADELHADACVSGPTWEVLAETYDAATLIDLIAVIGRYWTVAATLNSIGLPLDPDRPGFPPA